MIIVALSDVSPINRPAVAAGPALTLVAEGPRFVGGRENDAAADRNRPAAQARVKQLFDRRIKRVEVRVEDSGCGTHLVASGLLRGEIIAKVSRFGKQNASARSWQARVAGLVLGSPIALPPGHRIGVYHVPGLTGVGGWGEIHRAHDPHSAQVFGLEPHGGTGTPTNP
jgi:hypothetical protein